MPKLLGHFVVLGVLLTPRVGAAATLTFQPSSLDMFDLDHHFAYTWRIDGIDLEGEQIGAASIAFDDIRNWDQSHNQLFIYLLDTAKWGGLRSYHDDVTNAAPAPIADVFANPPGSSNWLVAAGTAQTKLDEPTFGLAPVDWTYWFSPSELDALGDYIASGGNLALGFDPDCHYFNNGVRFTLVTRPVPEPAITMLFGVALSGLATLIRRQRRR